MSNDSGGHSSDEFDYIIVGSGAGGGPLAARLALNGFRVLLIEAGSKGTAVDPPAASPEVSLVPSFSAVASENPELSWEFFVKHYDVPPAGPDPKWNIPKPGQDASREGIFYPRASAPGGLHGPQRDDHHRGPGFGLG